MVGATFTDELLRLIFQYSLCRVVLMVSQPSQISLWIMPFSTRSVESF